MCLSLRVGAQAGAAAAAKRVVQDEVERPDVWDLVSVDLASHDLRTRVQAGQSIRYLVPEGVEHIIRGQALYR